MEQYAFLIAEVRSNFNSNSEKRSMQFDQKFICLFEILLPCWHYFESAYISLLTLIYTFIFLQCHGDLNKTQVQKLLRKNSLSACHWHLNSLSAPNFSNFFTWKHMTQFINKTSHAYQKYTWIPQLLIMWLI